VIQEEKNTSDIDELQRAVADLKELVNKIIVAVRSTGKMLPHVTENRL
jgi:hypothetical protein